MPLLLLLSAALAIILLCLRSSGASRSVRLWTSLGTALFILLSGAYITADYFTGAGIDSTVVFHLQSGIGGAGLGEYAGIIALSVLLLILAVSVPVLLSRVITSPTKTSTATLLAPLAIAILCLYHPAALNMARLYDIALPGSSLFEPQSNAKGLAFEDYFYPVQSIEGDLKPVNIVVLYLESLERTYFDEAIFPGLMPNLKQLETQSLHFTDIRNLENTGFTIGGMVASQCGIPLMGTGSPNSMSGMDKFLPGVNCLGDLLSEQGYQMEYVGGASLEFAGKGKFYRDHGYQRVSGLEELSAQSSTQTDTSWWGLYDNDLLDIVYRRFEALSQQAEPFGLVTLTLDTHHPKGHKSTACDKEYGDGSNPMLNAVHCADALSSHFIQRIRQSPYAENTLLVVASDHIALKNEAYDELAQIPRRNLLMLFHPTLAQEREVTKPGSTVDIAPTLIDLLGGNTIRLGLGHSLLAEEPSFITSAAKPDHQVRKWRKELTAFWEMPESVGALAVDIPELTFTLDERQFRLPVLMVFDEDAKLEALRFEFDSKKSLPQQLAALPVDQFIGWIDRCNRVRAMNLELLAGEYCAFFGKTGGVDNISIQLSPSDSIELAAIAQLAGGDVELALANARIENLNAYTEYGAPDIRLFEHTVPADSVLAGLKVRSSGGPDTGSGIGPRLQALRLERGLNLLGVGASGSVEHLVKVDGCGAPESLTGSEALRNMIDQPSKPYGAYLIVVHDSAVCDKQDLTPLFEGLPLRQWQDLALRTPYIGVLTQGRSLIGEYVGSRGTSLILNLNAEPAVAASEGDDSSAH
ncbi:MAG: sulfatase-like hydrolase/transferase [Halioglobus sp.]